MDPHRVGLPMEIVYVLKRADGFHKIGVTGNAASRRDTLSTLTPKHLRPLTIVRQYNLGGLAPLVEKVAHAEMVSRGYAMHPNEWFDAGARACTAAVGRAIRLIEEIGPRGWMSRRIKARKALLKSRRLGEQEA